MTLLALETSCDETSAAVVRDGQIFSNVVSSQIKLHEEYGGVVPELAAREHLKNLLPVAQAALHEAGIEWALRNRAERREVVAAGDAAHLIGEGRVAVTLHGFREKQENAAGNRAHR